ncbi:tetratricopeptide repeat protein [Calycomorphotria hydatis]|uniref:Tetratricopeptide repeat protein n=1 Tax=Calycomorphotria hydatis TaxID=2528027 RepID=A0A517T6Q1_9PLAN|nr:hypothetical protein [Calycomorphotria hydatis]QDT64055.1 hypothetical protein V22_12850 [Calycomorphotria hydatis]
MKWTPNIRHSREGGSIRHSRENGNPQSTFHYAICGRNNSRERKRADDEVVGCKVSHPLPSGRGYCFQTTTQALTTSVARAILLLSFLLTAPITLASDRVILRSESGASQIPVVGTIIEYNGEEIHIQTGPTAVRIFETDRVIEVETPQQESHRQAIAAINSQKFAEAQELLAKALDDEQRDWVRQEIMALRVTNALSLGDRQRAITAFLALAEQDKQIRHGGLIPLEWERKPAPKELVAAARVWLKQRSETAQLIAASILLTSPAEKREAEDVLNKLSISFKPEIYALARVQLWRGQLIESPSTPGALRNWEQRIHEMPESLRGGPYFVLGEAYADILDHERAAAAFLWLPLVYDHDPYLAALAELRAAEHLRKVGRYGEAFTLCREVTNRFSYTPSSERAAKLIEEWKKQ